MNSQIVSSALKAEEEDNVRLRKAREYVAHSKDAEDRARVELARAATQTKRAREKFETLFAECQERAVARRKSGQIVNSSNY
jgi:hypothetical protein